MNWLLNEVAITAGRMLSRGMVMISLATSARCSSSSGGAPPVLNANMAMVSDSMSLASRACLRAAMAPSQYSCMRRFA